MYYTQKTSSGAWAAFARIFLTIIISTLVALIGFELLKAPIQRAGFVGTTGLLFGAMLMSLAAVVVSVILPERYGRVLLYLGTAGFFACLTGALVFGVRF